MQPAPGRPEAAATVWNWRSPEPVASAETGGRVRGLIQAAIGATIGGLLYVYFSTLLGTIVMSIAGLIGLAALLSPQGAFRAIERVFESLGQWVGRGMTWLLLPLLFYGFFAPFHLLLRRGKRDSMQRGYDPDAPTYWSERERGRSATDSPLKQY